MGVERVLGEMGKVEGYWKSSAKEKLPGIYKVILMRTPHNVDYSLNWPTSSQVRLQMARLGYVQFSCFLRESSGNPQIILAIAKTIKCSLRADSGAPQLRKNPHNSWNMEKSSASYVEPSTLSCNLFGITRYFAGY